MKDLITIIVPVYNVEKYLDNCLENIVKQTYSNIEIILVDDGSKDSSGAICDKWKKIDERITVIHKENAGLGYARNSGLEIAHGKYVMYIDSDDYMVNNMVEKLYSVVQCTGADTVYCGLKRVLPNGSVIDMPAYYNNESFEGKEILTKVLLEMIGSKPQEKEDALLFMSVWHALYSLKIIKDNNIRFPSEREIMSEDIIYHIEYLAKAKKVAYIADCLYCYRVNELSLSQVYDPTRFLRLKVLLSEIDERLDVILDSSEYLEREQRLFLGGTRRQIQSIVASGEKNKLKKIKEICQDKTLEKILIEYPYNENPIKHRLFNCAMEKKLYALLWLFSKLVLLSRR